MAEVITTLEDAKSEQISAAVTQPVRIDVGSVEAELAGIWRAAIGGCVPQTSAPATRAILSNLLIYAATHAEANEAKGAATAAMGDHPARTIITDAEDIAPERQADVAMLCNITEQGRRLCGEEIQLHPHKTTAAAVSMILPLLVPELPIYLWTPGDLVWKQDIAQHLVHIADHWIFDSRKFSDRLQCFRSIIDLGLQTRPQVVIHDLAWVSLSQWRESIARHFDPLPARAYLRGVTGVEIIYSGNTDEPPNMESLLLACWLICRLGWRLSGMNSPNGHHAIRVTVDNNELAIQLTPSQETKPAIEEVHIEAELDGKHAIFQSKHSKDINEVIMQADAPDLPQARHTIRMPDAKLSDMLLQVLNTPGADKIYEQAITLIAPMIGNLVPGR